MTDPGLPAADRLRVVLERIEVFVPCGLHPWERHPEKPNRLWVDLECFAPWPLPEGQTHIDYDRLRLGVLAWSQRPHVDLLETLLADACDLAFQDAAVQAVRVRIVKPDIFPETQGAGVELFRRRPV